MRTLLNLLYGLVVIGAILGPIVFYIWWQWRTIEFPCGYQLEGYDNALAKDYGNVRVAFYNWGTQFHDSIGVGKNRLLAEGVYALLISSTPLTLGDSSPLFDEVVIDTEKKFIVTLKKKGVYMGTPEFHSFLKKFDEAISRDLSISPAS